MNYKKPFLKIILIISSLVLVFFAVFTLSFAFMFKSINKQKLNTNNLNALKPVKQNEPIKNIAIFGIDSDQSTGRSDTIIIASINTETGSIKIINIARDTYINVPEHKNTKICHAYSYGGAELAIKTLNTNFKLDITDFITLNFEQLIKIVDTLGGIDIEISENELNEFNRIIGNENDKINKSGIVHINGRQALCY